MVDEAVCLWVSEKATGIIYFRLAKSVGASKLIKVAGRLGRRHAPVTLGGGQFAIYAGVYLVIGVVSMFVSSQTRAKKH